MTSKKSKAQLITDENKKEIFYNFINSALAAGLVFVGACVAGNIDAATLLAAFGAAAIVFLTKFKNYWDGEAGEYSKKVFNFIGV